MATRAFKIGDRVQELDFMTRQPTGLKGVVTKVTPGHDKVVEMYDVRWDGQANKNWSGAGKFLLAEGAAPSAPEKEGGLSFKGSTDFTNPQATQSGWFVYGVPAWKVGLGIGGVVGLGFLLKAVLSKKSR